MTETTRHFKSIDEYCKFAGFPKPEHPLFSISQIPEFDGKTDYACCGITGQGFSSDFYTIAIKHVISGELYYGRTKYDFSNGTMMFTAPRQEIRPSNMVVSKDAIVIAIHEDFIKGHPIRDLIRKYGFFSYAVNEALHLSPKEEKLLRSLMQNIHDEYHDNPDEFSRELILSQLDTLLKYANRYYKRQFINRAELSSTIADQFNQAMRHYFESGKFTISGLPQIEDIAQEMGLSARYLSDSLKAETGKAALEHIHLYLMDEAKDMLLEGSKSVSEVAYSLGFDYPQYFSRLFKKKTGLSPKAFQDQNSVH